jgi:glycosyltransferase involved in cell wall biosynthesis
VHGLLARELEFLPNINPLAKCFSRYSEKLALFLLKNIIVVAPQIEVIVKPMTKAKIFVIPNGINPDIIRGINPFPINYINTILFVGNLIKRKGIADLIKAISIVKKDIPDVHLLIAGTGSMENELKNLTTILLLENNVKFLGFLTEKTKFAYILSVDILVVPSLWESLPIVVLEGMICGKPIIASHVAGIPYLIHNDENGFLVEPRNSEKFAEKICTLLQNKSLREKMGKRSLEQVKELTWDKIASMTYTTYNAVIFREDIHK